MILFGKQTRFAEPGDVIEVHDGSLVLVVKNENGIVEARDLRWYERIWWRICTWGDAP